MSLISHLSKIPLEQKRAEMRKRMDIVAVSDISSGKFDAGAYIRIFIVIDKRSERLCFSARRG